MTMFIIVRIIQVKQIRTKIPGCVVPRNMFLLGLCHSWEGGGWLGGDSIYIYGNKESWQGSQGQEAALGTILEGCTESGTKGS
jgi:hypothetical protein